MSRSSQLFDLQQIDSQLDQHQSRVSKINKILANNSEVRIAETVLNAAESELESAEASLRKAMRKVQDQRLKIKQTDAKLYGGKIRNPKELQDLQEEGEALRRYLEVLEDRQLEQMLEVDTRKEIRESRSEALNKTIRKTEIYHQKLSKELTVTKTNIQSLNTKRQLTIQTISSGDQKIYRELRENRMGVAVSFVKDGACSACGATLTAALHQAARSPSRVTYCETCGRILFAN